MERMTTNEYPLTPKFLNQPQSKDMDANTRKLIGGRLCVFLDPIFSYF